MAASSSFAGRSSSAQRPRTHPCNRSASVAVLFPCNRGCLQRRMLVPSVETRVVTRIPCLAEPRGAQIPVWADFTRHGAQIMPKINHRWTTPKPVAVIDAVDDEARIEHERMRDHRIVLGVGVLLDVEILLNRSVRVRKEGPLRAH